jgi:hypothetical protein
MPTVPPTFISLNGEDVLIHHTYTVPDDGDTSLSSPTPDPDDHVLVPVVTGDGVGAITSVSICDASEAKIRWVLMSCAVRLTGRSRCLMSDFFEATAQLDEPVIAFPFLHRGNSFRRLAPL